MTYFQDVHDGEGIKINIFLQNYNIYENTRWKLLPPLLKKIKNHFIDEISL